MKRILKRYLPEHYRRQLSSLKSKFTLENLFVYFVGLLETSQAVNIKENIKLVGKMDYAQSAILMNLESSVQMSRPR